MRRSMIGAAVFITLLMGTTAAMAASVHFKHGSPTFTDNGVTLTASRALPGSGTVTC